MFGENNSALQTAFKLSLKRPSCSAGRVQLKWLTVISASDVGNMGEDKLLLCEGFVDQVLDCGVHVTCVVWSHDLLCEFGKQRGRNIMGRQIHEEVVFGS